MNVTIIHKDDCPRCEAAIDEFTADGHIVEVYDDLTEIDNPDRRNNMMADLMYAGGFQNMRPLVFIYDRFVPWTQKKGTMKWSRTKKALEKAWLRLWQALRLKKLISKNSPTNRSPAMQLPRSQ